MTNEEKKIFSFRGVKLAFTSFPDVYVKSTILGIWMGWMRREGGEDGGMDKRDLTYDLM